MKNINYYIFIHLWYCLFTFSAFNDLTKMCIYMHLICTNKVLIGNKIWCFFYALVPRWYSLNSSQIAPLEGIVAGPFFSIWLLCPCKNCIKFNENLSQIAPKSAFSAPLQKNGANKGAIKTLALKWTNV